MMDTHETGPSNGSQPSDGLWERKEASEVNETLYLGGRFPYPAWILLGDRWGQESVDL